MRTCGAMLSEPDLAENAAHDAFEAAFGWLAAGKPIERPEHLRAWLCGIGRNRCRRQWASRDELAPLPAEVSDDNADQASRQRMAQVESMLQAVAATFTEPQQQLYRYVIGEGLSGARLGERMGISAETACRQAYKVINLAHDGFGALVLARDGRRFCMVYALCFPASTPTSDGSNPLLGRLLDVGQGGVTAVDQRFSIWFDPSAGAVIDVLRQPNPLPPECFDPGADRTTWALSRNGAAETVRVDSAWGEVGIVPLSPATASALRAEVTAQLRSCFVFGLSGSNATINSDSMSTPVAWMRTFIIRNVGQVPPAYLGDGVSWQYTAWGVTGNDYIYATSFSPSVCRDLAISLANKQ